MAKQVRQLAIHKRLDPKSSSSVAPYGKNMMKAQDSESEGEQEGRKNDFKHKNRWKNREARAAQDGERGGGGERKGPMLCCNLPIQTVFKQGDGRVMPPQATPTAGRAVQRTISVSTTGTKLVARRRALVFTAVT